VNAASFRHIETLRKDFEAGLAKQTAAMKAKGN